MPVLIRLLSEELPSPPHVPVFGAHQKRAGRGHNAHQALGVRGGGVKQVGGLGRGTGGVRGVAKVTGKGRGRSKPVQNLTQEVENGKTRYIMKIL